MLFIVHNISEQYRPPLQLVLRQFCGAVDKYPSGCRGEWLVGVEFNATANDSLWSFSVVGRREAPP